MRPLISVIFITVLATTACGGSSDSSPDGNSVSTPDSVIPAPDPGVPTPDPTPTPTPTQAPIIAVEVPEPINPSAFSAPSLTPSVCDTGLPGDAPDSVTLTFAIEAPENTPDGAQIFYTPRVQGQFDTSNPDFEAILQPDGTYGLSIDLAPCTMLEFQFTRGTLDQAERDPTGNIRSNRVFRIEDENTVLPIRIESWSDLSTPLREIFWNTPTPTFNRVENAPQITLIGEPVAFVALGQDYLEEGAVAIDLQDGLISEDIVISDNVDTSNVGDYWVRYSVSDSDNNAAIEKSRIVRVYDEQFSNYSVRPVGDTPSHLGYLEHLPSDYGEPGVRYPLVISHHGGGGGAPNIRFSLGGSPLSSAFAMTEAGGLGSAVYRKLWPHDSPAIVLVPQRSISAPPNLPRIDAFVQFAKEYYAVDESRIYMEGWSQGGFITALYGSDFPGVIAAGVSIAGGFFFQPNNPCGMMDTPLWAIHGDADNIVNVDQSRAMVSQINDCGDGSDPARITIFPGFAHFGIQRLIYGETLVGRESAQYQAFDESVHDWLLRQSLPEAP